MEQPEKQPSKLKGRKLEPKYRDPETGKTWAGRGRIPSWVVGDKERYRIFIHDSDDATINGSNPNPPECHPMC